MKQSPETWRNDPDAAGAAATDVSSSCHSSLPLIARVTTRFANGSVVAMAPRVIVYGGPLLAGQNVVALRSHVSGARMPPACWAAKSAPVITR